MSVLNLSNLQKYQFFQKIFTWKVEWERLGNRKKKNPLTIVHSQMPTAGRTEKDQNTQGHKHK